LNLLKQLGDIMVFGQYSCYVIRVTLLLSFVQFPS
jgi:hypothetical protein